MKIVTSLIRAVVMMRSGKANRLWNWTKGQIGMAVAPQNKRGEHSQQSCDTCEHLRGLDQSTRLAPASPANDQDRQRPSGLIDKRPGGPELQKEA